MPDHIQVTFHDIQPEQQEILIAHLAEIGFESFEEKETELNAFIVADNYDETLLHNLIFKYQLDFSKELITAKNWNEIWESHFDPVVIDDFAAIRADFHPPVKGVKHEIIITPKMSFGTGHHATTRMMIRQLKEIDCQDKLVFDFGTGTGILALLAEKLGAKKVFAIDNDDWSIENAKENFERNQSQRIELVKSSIDLVTLKFDIILANINKHVILENFHRLVNSLKENGILLLSGLMADDREEVNEIAENHNLVMKNTLVENNWICISFDY